MFVRTHRQPACSADETESRMRFRRSRSFIPLAEKPDEELVLPGTLQAYDESPIYARTNGYLLRWYKDIGSRVNKGRTAGRYRHAGSRSGIDCRRAPARQQVVAQMDLAKINADR